MNNLDKYKGIIPAFYACYDEDGNIDIQGNDDDAPLSKQYVFGVNISF